MGWLRVVVGVGLLWLLSIVVAVAGLELAHRTVLAKERAAAMQAAGEKASALSVRVRPTL